MPRVIIFGSHNWSDVSTVQMRLARLDTRGLTIVHGACYPRPNTTGERPHLSADWLAELWAQANAVPTDPHPADWGGLGRSAGPIRNEQVCKLGADYAIGFRSPGVSTGTDGMRSLCQRFGIPGELIHYDRKQEPWALLNDTWRLVGF